jgi:hypothetical protein
MSGIIPPLPPYTLTAWCSAKAHGEIYLDLYLYLYLLFEQNVVNYSYDPNPLDRMASLSRSLPESCFL